MYLDLCIIPCKHETKTGKYQHTYWSSCSSSVESDSTQVSSDTSCGSILLQSRDTTDMDECSVSLWTWDPCSRMNVRTQFSPPDSNTAPDSRVQINSKTCHTIKDAKCYWLFLFFQTIKLFTPCLKVILLMVIMVQKIKSTFKSEFFKSLSNLFQIYLLKFLFPIWFIQD